MSNRRGRHLPRATRGARLAASAGLALGLPAVLSLGLAAAPASANPVSAGGQVVFGPPVADVAQDGTPASEESDTVIHAFTERTDLTLATSVPVDVSPSVFPHSYTVTSLSPGTVPAGTKVDSYMFYTNPVGKLTTDHLYAGTATFSSRILGVIVTDTRLAATDPTLGAPGSTYSTATDVGIEPAADRIELVGPDTISLNLSTSNDIDTVRVIVASGGSGVGAVAPRYTEVAADGGIFNFHSAFFGSTGGVHLNAPMVGGTEATGRPGYWTVASDGGVFSFGSGAPFYGSLGAIHLNKPIVGMASTTDGLGYWLVASDGGVFSFGDAGFHGSLGRIHLSAPIVGMAPTPNGRGYWLVASDGGVFSFGNAGFFGSLGRVHLNKPIVGIAAMPNGLGYWLVASDGGVFSFGSAGFHGSLGAVHLNKPVVGMKATQSGNGYWLFASDGGVFSFGDAPFFGSMGAVRLVAPVVAAF